MHIVHTYLHCTYLTVIKIHRYFRLTLWYSKMFLTVEYCLVRPAKQVILAKQEASIYGWQVFDIKNVNLNKHCMSDTVHVQGLHTY